MADVAHTQDTSGAPGQLLTYELPIFPPALGADGLGESPGERDHGANNPLGQGDSLDAFGCRDQDVAPLRPISYSHVRACAQELDPSETGSQALRVRGQPRGEDYVGAGEQWEELLREEERRPYRRPRKAQVRVVEQVNAGDPERRCRSIKRAVAKPQPTSTLILSMTPLFYMDWSTGASPLGGWSRGAIQSECRRPLHRTFNYYALLSPPH